MVVIAPVEPGQKTVTSPSTTDDFFTIESVWGVILIISQRPFVFSEMASLKIIAKLAEIK
jgi:hypothetical protein